MTQTAEEFAVRAWRDHDEEACGLPGMSLGTIRLPEVTGEVCDDLWRDGVRRVALDEPVDLAATGAAAARRAVGLLSLVRELTARAVHVDWELRLPDDGEEDTWKLLSHLRPPRALANVRDAEAALYAWRTNHYLCKFLWRRGPGFLQIRDRRWGELRRFTADEAEYGAAVRALEFGADHTEVDAAVLAEFTEELLVLRVGDVAWWLPYRVNRWLQEAMAI
ncbi:MAG: hypothetical protein H5T76_17135 [Streptomyces sp.]|nr:hypothetical protein [Streptomyces sp.]